MFCRHGLSQNCGLEVRDQDNMDVHVVSSAWQGLVLTETFSILFSTAALIRDKDVTCTGFLIFSGN